VRGGDDRRILVGKQFFLCLDVTRQKNRLRSQKITHARHADYCAVLGGSGSAATTPLGSRR
jgi:hypothetical protein